MTFAKASEEINKKEEGPVADPALKLLRKYLLIIMGYDRPAFQPRPALIEQDSGHVAYQPIHHGGDLLRRQRPAVCEPFVGCVTG